MARKFVTGANWSAAIHNPFRAFGSTGEGLENTLPESPRNSAMNSRTVRLDGIEDVVGDIARATIHRAVSHRRTLTLPGF